MADEFASIFVKLGLDASGFKRGLQEAKGDIDQFDSQATSKAEGIGNKIGGALKAGLAVGAVAAAGVGAATSSAINSYAALEKSALNAASKTGATGAAFDANTQKVINMSRELGRMPDNAFGPQEISDALAGMAAGGLDVANSSTKDLNAVIQLATASQYGLADSADMAMSTMSMYGLQMSDMGHISDVYVRATGDSAAGMEDLRYAMQQVGPVASSMGIGLEKTLANLEAFSQKGIKGEKAGTALRDGMNTLVSSTPAVSKALATMGLTMADVDPRSKDFNETLADMKRRADESGRGMAAFNDVFGVSGGLLYTLAAATPEVEHFQDRLENSTGAAANMAQQMNSGVGAALDAMMGGFQDLSIAVGDYLKGPATSFAQWISGIIGPIEEFGQAIGTGDWAKAGDMLQGAFKQAWDYIKSIDWQGMLKGAVDAIGGLASKFLSSFSNVNWPEIGTKIQTGIKTAFDTLKDLGKDLYGWLMAQDWGAVGASIVSYIKMQWANLNTLGRELADFIIQGIQGLASLGQAVGDAIIAWAKAGGARQLGTDIGGMIGDGLRTLIDIGKAVGDAILSWWRNATNGKSIIDVIKGALNKASEFLAIGAEIAKAIGDEILEKIKTPVGNAGIFLYDTFRRAGREVVGEMAYLNAEIINKIGGAFDSVKTTITEWWSAVSGTLDSFLTKIGLAQEKTDTLNRTPVNPGGGSSGGSSSGSAPPTATTGQHTNSDNSAPGSAWTTSYNGGLGDLIASAINNYGVAGVIDNLTRMAQGKNVLDDKSNPGNGINNNPANPYGNNPAAQQAKDTASNKALTDLTSAIWSWSYRPPNEARDAAMAAFDKIVPYIAPLPENTKQTKDAINTLNGSVKGGITTLDNYKSPLDKLHSIDTNTANGATAAAANANATAALQSKIVNYAADPSKALSPGSGVFSGDNGDGSYGYIGPKGASYDAWLAKHPESNIPTVRVGAEVSSNIDAAASSTATATQNAKQLVTEYKNLSTASKFTVDANTQPATQAVQQFTQTTQKTNISLPSKLDLTNVQVKYNEANAKMSTTQISMPSKLDVTGVQETYKGTTDWMTKTPVTSKSVLDMGSAIGTYNATTGDWTRKSIVSTGELNANPMLATHASTVSTLQTTATKPLDGNAAPLLATAASATSAITGKSALIPIDANTENARNSLSGLIADIDEISAYLAVDIDPTDAETSLTTWIAENLIRTKETEPKLRVGLDAVDAMGDLKNLREAITGVDAILNVETNLPDINDEFNTLLTTINDATATFKIDADETLAAGNFENLTYAINTNTSTLRIAANSESAMNSLINLMGIINASEGTTHINAEDSLASKALSVWETKMNYSHGTSHIDAEWSEAKGALDDCMKAIKKSSAKVTIGANASEAYGTLKTLVEAISRTKATVTVNVVYKDPGYSSTHNAPAVNTPTNTNSNPNTNPNASPADENKQGRDLNGNGIIGRALGGPVTAGRSYWVGEEGPEPFIPSQSGTIISRRQLGGQIIYSPTYNLSGTFDEEDVRRMLEKHDEEFKQELARDFSKAL